jgi:Secretion system C-terminal sorting domain
MRTIFLFSFFLIQLTSIAQWPEFNRAHPVSCQWAPYNYIDDGAFENVFVIDTNPNYYDGYMTFGKGILCNPGTTNNPTRVFSSKISTNGELLSWTRYDSTNFNLSQEWFNVLWYWNGGMSLNHNNDIVGVLTSRDYTIGFDADVNYLVKFNLFGDVKSQHIIDSTIEAQYIFTSVCEDVVDSTYALTGYYKGPENPQGSGVLLKVDSLGSILWQSYFANTNGSFSSKKSLDGGYWVLVQSSDQEICTNSNFVNTDFILIKTDNYGAEEGRYIFGGACSSENASVIETSEDHVVLIGRITEQVTTDNFPFQGHLFSTLIEQDNSGQLIETTTQREYLHTYDGHFVDLHIADNGDYFIVCDNQLTPSQGSGSQARWLGGILALAPDRDSLWFRSYSYFNNFPLGPGARPAYHYLLDSKMTSDHGVVLCGYITQMSGDPNNGLDTPWIFKVDSMGCLEPGCQYVNVEEIVIGLENTVSVFPNPASDIVNLTFTFPENFVPNNQNELVIIDMQGREVLRQSISLFASQNNQIQINISSLSSGVYTLHWISNNAWLDSIKLVVD